MKNVFLLVAATTLFLSSASAQSSYEIGGAVMDRDGMMVSDMFNIARTNHNFGTARSMAMGGAFTSLGADMSSLMLNPAGIGMYRNGEVSVTPMIGVTAAENSAANYTSNKKTRFALANVGGVINVLNDVGKVSLTFGVGYNRISDYNYRNSFQSSSPYQSGYISPSINDAFCRQLNAGNISPNADGKLPFNTVKPYFWGGTLAYDTYLINKFGDGWGRDELGDNAGVRRFYDTESKGSTGEFDITFAGNYDGKLYFGITLGIQDVSQTQSIYYGEEYDYQGGKATDSQGTPLPKGSNYMNYDQSIITTGSGVNVKFGLVYRPTDGLRIGVAYHTPTYYSLSRQYQASMSTQSTDYAQSAGNEFIYSSARTPIQEDFGSDRWVFSSPMKLLIGASYTFGRYAILSVDYERDWYNTMNVSSVPSGFSPQPGYYNNQFENNFTGSNTVRAGVEVRPVQFFALRAGFGYNGSMIKDPSAYQTAMMAYETFYYTAGLGFKFGRVNLDFAYQYVDDRNTDYRLFYSYDTAAKQYDVASERYSTKLVRHNIAMTLGVKF